MSGPLSPGEVIGSRYEVVGDLGEGGMQFVYLAHDNLADRMVALKTPKNRSAVKRFRRSAVVAAKVNHPNVAKTLDYVREGNNRYLIEELVVGEDLQKALLRRASMLDPYSAAKVFHHLAKGVAAAHHAGVVHRDLKPTNVMVVGGYSLSELKITDFGIAKMAGEELAEAVEGGEATMTMSQTAVGALPYMAPEVINGEYVLDNYKIEAQNSFMNTITEYTATAIKASLSEDGETAVLTFKPHGHNPVCVHLSSAALRRLVQQATEELKNSVRPGT